MKGRKNFKKIIALLLSMTMILSMSITVFAEDEDDIEGGSEFSVCEVTEGCTLEAGHEGECVVEAVVPPQDEELGKTPSEEKQKTKSVNTPAVANVDDSDYEVSNAEEFDAAFKEAQAGAVISLSGDVTLANDYEINKDIILDLNTHILQIDDKGTEATGCFNIYQSNLTVKNGTLKGAICSYSGNVVIENLSIETKSMDHGVEVKKGALSATNCYFKYADCGNRYAVYFSAERTAEVNAFMNLTNCRIESKNGGVNYGGKNTEAVIDNCQITLDDTSKNAIRVYSDKAAELKITNSTISNAGGKAVYIQQAKAGGIIELGEGNMVNGEVRLEGAADSYKLNVTGGQFSNGDSEQFAFKNNDSSLKVNLNLTGGQFSKNVEDFVASGYTCIKRDATEYPYEVVEEDENAAKSYYTQVEDVKTYYDTFAEAVESVKGTNATVYLKANAELENPADLEGLTLKGRAGVTVSYEGSAADFVKAAKNIAMSDMKLAFSDAALTKLIVTDGAISEATGLTSDNYADYVSLLAADSLVDASTYEVKNESNFEAKIGQLGYSYLATALNIAMTNDNDKDDIVNDEIVLLKDKVSSYAYGAIIGIDDSGDYDNATFTIDFNKHKLTANDAVVVINHNDVNITLKNGSVESKNSFGIATNGSKTGMKLQLENMEVISGAGAALYLAGDGETTIQGGSYTGVSGIEIRAGELYLSENPTVTGGTGELLVNENSNGSTTSNAALAIAQHTTKHPIKVVIKDGTYAGTAAVNEADPQGNAPTNVTVEIQGGVYTGTVASADCTKFISGGTYSEMPADEYVVDGKIAISYAAGSNNPVYYIGTQEEIQEIVKDAQSGDKITVMKGDLTLNIPANDVTVENQGDGKVTVNDRKLAQGETWITKKDETDQKPSGSGDGKTDGKGSGTGAAVKTGDNNQIGLFAAMMLLAVLLAAEACMIKKRKN